MEVTPFIIHFGSLRCKSVFSNFAARVWRDLVDRKLEAFSGARHGEADQQQLACA
jgi:hypothetical protein